MYSAVVRSKEYEKNLLDFISYEYSIDGLILTPAKRGFYGETWRLDAPDAGYFLKLVYAGSHMAIYERSFRVIKHICDHGINFISQIVVSKDGSLFKMFDGAVLGVFNWINGELIQTNATKIHEYEMLAKVYTVPTSNIPILSEDVSDKNAIVYYNQRRMLKDGPLLSLLEKYHAKIKHRADRLKHFADLCRGDTYNYFITHGDAGGNFINDGDKNYLVDWDYAILAPPERDAWVMCCEPWAAEIFQNAMRNNGIIHTIRPNWLAFYCYCYFFFYLSAFLDADSDAETVDEYINGWIENSFKYADNV